jgi:hypothetical protein
MTVAPETLATFEAERAIRMRQRLEALQHPAGLLDHVVCLDSRTGERFGFTLSDSEAGWYWQRQTLDAWLEHPLNLVLKARQLGITWLAVGYLLWKLLSKPGTRGLIVSINEDEAIKVVNRAYDMFESLPDHLRFGAEVTKPARGARPSTLIELTFPDGTISSVVGLPSTRRAGHGEVAAVVLLDEYSRHEYAGDSWKAMFSVADNGGQIFVISTANGVSNEKTGEGNFFHHLYVNAESYGIDVQFLPWSLHPDRDDAWYANTARALPSHMRAEQYPLNPEDAFINTGECWFDLDALAWYSEHAVLEEKERYRFVSDHSGGKAKLHKQSNGWLRVYARPEPERDYAIGADVATGRGRDYSCAYVIDLSNMGLAAELYGRLDADEYAEQLHFLGRWFNNARLAVEMGGGYGEPVVISLRDGRRGRPHYPRLYRHKLADRPDTPEMQTYGFPMNTRSRPQVINQIEQAIREKSVPALPRSLLMECRTFVRQNTLPSPRAQDGANDDRVLAFGIALEMYRQYGRHERKVTRRAKRSVYAYPWQKRRSA